MKRTLALILALVMTMALVACGGDPATGSGSSSKGTTSVMDASDATKNQQTEIDETKTYKKEIIVGIKGAVTQYDPHFSTGNTPDTAYKMNYNQLINFDFEKNNIAPELAESWVMESPSTYTFKLRQGVKFSNGEEFTADDVLWSLKERREKVGATTGAGWNFTSIEIINDYEVRVTLDEGNVDFLFNLAHADFPMMNREACEADAENGHWVGTGGWIVESWVPNDKIVYTRFDDSWVWEESGVSPTEKVTFRQMDETAAIAIALQNDEIQATNQLALADVPALEASGTAKSLTFNAATLYYCFFNMTNGKFAENQELRQAVAYALNYEELIDYATDGLGSRAVSLWGFQQYGLYEDFETQYDRDDAKVKELLAAAGYPNGIEFDMITSNSSIGTLIKAQLDPLGFTVNVNVLDSAGINAACANNEFDMAFFSISLQSFGNRFWFIPDPTVSTNRAHYDNAYMRDLYAKAQVETDDAKRKEIYKEIQEILHEELPYIPLYYQVRTVGYTNKTSGIQWCPDTKIDYTYIKCEE